MPEAIDHRDIARDQDLFHFQEEAPGMVLWHARGLALCRALEQAARAILCQQDYAEVRSPQLIRQPIWEASGHWQHFAEGMFKLEEDDGDASWDAAKQALEQAARGLGSELIEQPGEGAFYGPKLEFKLAGTTLRADDTRAVWMQPRPPARCPAPCPIPEQLSVAQRTSVRSPAAQPGTSARTGRPGQRHGSCFASRVRRESFNE